MGGQACVLYGAAQFSRDTDLAILCEPANLGRLQNAMDELQAKVIAVPPFEADYLERGHTVQFRCAHPDAEDLRVDVMAKMRGVDSFESLWARRTTIESSNERGDAEIIEVMSLPDLVTAKKTQLDKDWPMIRRLVEVHYLQNRDQSTPERIGFWLCQLRTPTLLQEVSNANTTRCKALLSKRPLLRELSKSEDAIESALRDEEDVERQLDREYWLPLKRELEQLRRQR